MLGATERRGDDPRAGLRSLARGRPRPAQVADLATESAAEAEKARGLRLEPMSFEQKLSHEYFA